MNSLIQILKRECHVDRIFIDKAKDSKRSDWQKDQNDHKNADDPRDVRCLSFSPNGDVLNGNAYREDIMSILDSYTCD
jgi:hypothetical protein